MRRPVRSGRGHRVGVQRQRHAGCDAERDIHVRTAVAGAAALFLETTPGATPADVASALISNSTSGVVGNPGSGSPNRLLYTGFIGGGGGPSNQAPVARFTVTCSGFTCALDATTSTDDAGVVSYSWDLGRFPDPTATGATVTVTYPHEGPRTVTLTVADAGGLTSTATQTFDVGGTTTEPPPSPPPPPTNQPPVADFTVTCGANFTCTFDGTISTDDQGVVSWDWDVGKFPDPAASGSRVTIVYPHAGPRTVVLTVRDAAGLTSTRTKTFDVQE